MTLRIQLKLLAVAFGCAAGIILVSWVGTRMADEDPAKLGFAVNSVAVLDERFEGRFISGSPTTLPELCATATFWQKQGYRVILLLGASQLFSITNPTGNGHLAVYYANRDAEKIGSNLRFVQACAANATPHEQLVLYLACRQFGFRPDGLLLGLFYRPLNEAGLRASILELAKILPDAEIASLGEAGKHIRAALDKIQAPAAEPLAATQTDTQTMADLLETRLTAWLAKVWPVYGQRDMLRTSLEAETVREAASLAFRFSSAKRPVARINPEMESWQLTALDAAQATARQDRTPFLIYKVPHQPGLAPFYHDRNEYDAFFSGVAERCGREGIAYSDLELLVPKEYWNGYTQFRLPDVFHFQDEGHALLGQALFSFVQGALTR